MHKRFNHLIISCALNGYSDVHIRGGQAIVYRKDGAIRFDNKNVWTYQDVDELVHAILNPNNMAILRDRWSVDFAATVGNVRIRINVFNTDRGPSLAIRLLPTQVPTIEKLNLHPALHDISELKSGLVLICGTNGSGKTTAIASILDDINHKRAAHIVTLEDPIEYRIQSRTSFVEQREIGTHVPSFERGLIDVMREDPDVIMVGEMRDPQTIALTLNAAESGHLVIATLHATNMEDALYRIINSAPLEAEEYIRHQLASTITWITLQKLIYLDKVGFRVPLLSIMRGSQQIKGLIREKKLFQIENSMHTGKLEGMFTQDRYLKEFIERKERFYNPMANFNPEAGVMKDLSYNSTVFDSRFDLKSKAGNMRNVIGADLNSKQIGNKQVLMPDAENLFVQDQTESQYSIDESYDLQEIIAETEKKIEKKQ